MCYAYNKEYGLKYSIARIFNAIGPGDWPSEKVGHGHVIPDMVKKIIQLNQNPVKIRGSGQQTRSFVDVRDLVEGLVQLMENPKAENQTFNLGTENEVSILELLNLIWKRSGKTEKLEIEKETTFEKDVVKRVPDTSKARNLLGWEPKYDLETSLKEYIKAYKKVKMNGTQL